MVANVARSLGALTIGVVTRPFGFEGKRRAIQAEAGIERLRSEVDTLIVIPNDRLLSISDRHVSVLDAFKAADQVLLSGVQGITDLITTPGLINLDFADVKSVMSGAGSALMGIGSSRGEDRAVAAAEMAISSPLLEASIDGAHGVLLSIQGGSDLGLFEINEAAQLVANSAARGRQHHLRRGHRRRPRRRGARHGHRRRVRREPDGPDLARGRRPQHHGPQPAPGARPGAGRARQQSREPGPVVRRGHPRWHGRKRPRGACGVHVAGGGDASADLAALAAAEIPTAENTFGGNAGGAVAAGYDRTVQPGGTVNGAPDGAVAGDTAGDTAGSPVSGTAEGTAGYDAGHDAGAHTGDSGGDWVRWPTQPNPGDTAPWDISAADAGEPDGSGGSAGGDSPVAGAAARVFDVATTRRRPVIFEEEDDLDVPDFLK